MSNKTWFKFYQDSWLTDPELRACPPIARSLLIDLMCLSNKTGGYIRHDIEQIRKMLGYNVKTFHTNFNILLKFVRVCKDKDGTYFIKRMVEEHCKYIKFSEIGKRGGNPTLKPPLKQTLKPEEEVEVEVEEEEDKECNKNDIIKEGDKISEEDLKTVQLFLDNSSEDIKKNFKEKTGLEWANQIRLCREKDGYTIQQIEDIIIHFRNDDFWAKNFKSIAKLRKKDSNGIKYIDRFFDDMNRSGKKRVSIHDDINDQFGG